MNLKKLMKMLEAETDKEKAAEVLRKIDSLIIRKGVLRMGPFGYLHPLELESHICKRDAFKDYFDCDTWGYKWVILYEKTASISNLTMPELKSCCP